jgi:hypothetical protein
MRKRDARVAFFWLAVFAILFYKDIRNYSAAKSLCSAGLIFICGSVKYIDPSNWHYNTMELTHE